MTKPTEKLYLSASKNKNENLEQSFEKKLNDVNNFIGSMNNIKQMITYFKDKTYKSKTR